MDAVSHGEQQLLNQHFVEPGNDAGGVTRRRRNVHCRTIAIAIVLAGVDGKDGDWRCPRDLPQHVIGKQHGSVAIRVVKLVHTRETSDKLQWWW